MRLWMLLAGTITAAAVMGVSLGSYVTRVPVSPLAESAQAAPVGIEPDVAPLPAPIEADSGPGEIRCKGCGPTLAERRWMKDMAGTQEEDPPEPVVDLDMKVDPLPSAVAANDETPFRP